MRMFFSLFLALCLCLGPLCEEMIRVAFPKETTRHDVGILGALATAGTAGALTYFNLVNAILGTGVILGTLVYTWARALRAWRNRKDKYTKGEE